MAINWTYGDGIYRTEAEVDAAVSEMKYTLDNRPTSWVQVKLLTGSDSDGWTTPADRLTDEQIKNLDDSSYYNVSSITHGVTYTAITGVEAKTRIWGELRSWFADDYSVNRITKREEYAPTNEDM